MKTKKKKISRPPASPADGPADRFADYSATDELILAVKEVQKVNKKNDLLNLLNSLFALPKKTQQNLWPNVYALLCLFQPKVIAKLKKANLQIVVIGNREELTKADTD